ncbi:MAG: hypothetical protein GWP08_07465 [Nitrospiraceae bacterium]|nr:hypothetical protein [Nitrospiraceae bacterium]
MTGLLLLVLAAALPPGAIVVEAESFVVESGWEVGAARAEMAPGGLSGGLALNSNVPGAIARQTVGLPEGSYHAWVRAFDQASATGHYQAKATLGGQPFWVGVSAPIYGAFAWEPLGEVAGGNIEIVLSDPHDFNSVIDCFVFTQTPGPPESAGAALELLSVSVDASLPEGRGSLSLSLRPSEAMSPAEVTVALSRNGGLVWHEAVALPESHWEAGEPVTLPDISLDGIGRLWAYVWPGVYELFVAIPESAWAAGRRVHTFTKAAEVMPAPCKAEIRPHAGAPTVWIDGRPEFPFTYLNHQGDRDRYYQHMADAGVRFFTASASMGIALDGQDFAGCDEPFLDILAKQPQALIFPRVGVTPPSWWLDAHPDERVVFDDGSAGFQSMFSQAWLKDACEWVEAYSRHIRSSPFADHIIGIHICSGTTGEWQSWGLWDGRRGDFSRPAIAAWRDYLTRRYGNDETLTAAWGRAASLASATIPTRERREEDTGLLRSPAEYQDVIDFYDYYWRGTANALEALAAAAKRGGGRDWLVGFFYGYEMQYGGKMQESQHLGMKQVLECPDIDFFSSPAMYTNRRPGGTSTFMSLTESVRAHGKIWWDEADIRTHLSIGLPFGEVTPAQSLAESLDVLEREFAHCWVRRAPLWWFDMNGGWYDDPAILGLFEQMRAFGEQDLPRWAAPVEIGVFVDDKSAYRMAPDSAYLDAVRDFAAELPRLGAPYDTYLLSDLAEAPEYKAYIFPLAFDLTDAERAAIEALKRDGKTLFFMGAAGIGRYGSGRVAEDAALSQALVEAPQSGSGIQTLNHGAWRSAWSETPAVSMAELRGLLRQTGDGPRVHLYHDGDDALYVGEGFLALHAQTAGIKMVRFPEPLCVTELFSETPLEVEARPAYSVTFVLEANETRCFALAPEETRMSGRSAPGFRRPFQR